MAIIETTGNAAIVNAATPELSASVTLNGALMDMLAGTYSFGLLAAVREAIQNGCDAARRNGLSLSEGCLVKLPTLSNPMFTCVDKGAGMTHEFMSTSYLSFGSSTKSSDDNSSGGLGIGRWAAYGYIKEAYITTANELELIERTYFQYQGEDGTPKVRLAGEQPTATAGTQVSFPVKDTDLDEVYFAVSWLKHVMQITMGDSFSVDESHLLTDKILGEQSVPTFDLAEVDETLSGIKVYFMNKSELSYGQSETLSSGSLIVLTNKETNVGGLPFHVKIDKALSVFSRGAIVEIPMRYRVPFMPSREQVKYTDEMNSLITRIDAAVRKYIKKLISELYSGRFFSQKKLLKYLGQSATPLNCLHNFANLPDFKAITGYEWHGQLYLPKIDNLPYFRYFTKNGIMKSVAGSYSGYSYKDGPNHVSVTFTLATLDTLKLFIVDCPGGLSRIRELNPKNAIVFYGDTPEMAIEHFNAFVAEFGPCSAVKASTLLKVAKVKVVSGVSVRSTKTKAIVWSSYVAKQESEHFDYLDATVPQLYLVKDGSEIPGYKNFDFRYMSNTSYGLQSLMALLGYSKIWLLTKKQEAEILEAKREFDAAGFSGKSSEELLADFDSESVANYEALNQWVSLKDSLLTVIEANNAFSLIEKESYRVEVLGNHQFSELMSFFKSNSGLELVGTKLDKSLMPYIDLLTGMEVPSKVLNAMAANAVRTISKFLNLIDFPEDVSTADPWFYWKTILSDKGLLNFHTIYRDLVKEFPLLSALRVHHLTEVSTAKDVIRSLKHLYS